MTGTVEEIDASVLTKQFTDFFNTYSAAVLDEFSAYKQSMEKYLTEIAGVYDSYVSKTEGLFAQYESQFNERYSSFESTLDNWDNELLSAYTDFMAKIKLFQSDAENEFNTWFESIKDKLGGDIAGSLQLQIEELAAAMQEVKEQAEAGTKETKEAIAALDERLKRVESGWGIDYKHDAVLGSCYMGAAYMSQHYERTEETAVLGDTYVGILSCKYILERRQTMKGFPKVLKTKEDYYNCLAMVASGELAAADLLAKIESAENQRYIECGVAAVEEEKKAVTVYYCDEAAVGMKFVAGSVSGTGRE
ncbi:hypothetical protein ACI3EW_00960 [Pilosibacter sp. HC1M1C21]